MLPQPTMDDDLGWAPDDAPPPPRKVTTLPMRVLSELVARAPAVITLAEEARPPQAPEIREVVVARGIEVRSPLRLLRWTRRAAEAPSYERPPRA